MSENETLLRLSKDIKLVVDLESAFAIKDEIGRGESSIVYMALRLKDGKKFAVKIRFKKMPDKSGIKLYANEVRAIYQCKSPYTLKLTGYTIKPPLAIVTELIEGDTLTKHLKQKDLDNSQKNIIALKIAYSMNHIHEEEFIHRSLTSDNIIIDSQFSPKICDFGDCRFPLVSKRNVCREEDPLPNWMPPEYMTCDVYNEKLDVYSFGMILYQLFTDERIPFYKTKEKKLTKKIVKGMRPDIPETMPMNLKDLITKCWDEKPEKRPSFKDILQLLKSQTVTFPGIDNEKIAAALKALDADDEEMKKEQYKILIRTPLPDFRDELLRRVPLHQPNYVPLFFKELRHLYAEKTSVEQFSYIMDVSQKLIQNKHNCEAFVKARLHYRLPFDREELIDQGLNILFLIAIHVPNEFNKEYSQFIRYLMTKRPDKIIVLVSELAKKLDELKDPLPVIDAVMKSWKVAFKSPSAAAPFLSLFYYLCRVYPDYKKQRIEVCKTLFSRFLNCQSKTAICVAYNGLSYFVGPNLAIDFKHAIKCLKDKNTANTILSVMLKLDAIQLDEKDVETQKEFVNVLLVKAQQSNRASLLLCKLAEDDGCCAKILAENNSWLSCELPTIDATFKIMLVLIQHKSLKKIIAQSKDLMYLLYSACDQNSGISMKIILQTCLAFGVTEENIDLWDKSGFLQKCMNYAYDLNDERSYINCFALFHEITFVKEIAILQDVIDVACIAFKKFEGTHKMVVSLFTNLSHIPNCAMKMDDIGVLDLIQDELTSDEFQKLSSVLKKNLHSAQILQSSMASATLQ